MSKEIYISSTPHETRLAIVENDELAEIYYERENEYTLAGSIYNGKVTRVLPGMQSSFVDIGLERDAFLYITDFMEEAGDSADFDSGEAGNRGRGRESRGGDAVRSGEPRDDRRDDRRREGTRPASSFVEGASPEPGQMADGVEPRQEVRSDRTDRSDRGGDRRDRSRRRDERSGNRDDRSGGRDSRPPAFLPAESSAASNISAATPGLNLTGDSERPADVASLGEGALGADGSRRWRGRRGRRRGRGPGQEQEAGQPEFAAEPMGEEPAGNLVNEPGGFDPGHNLSSATDAFDITEAEAAGNFDLDASATGFAARSPETFAPAFPGTLEQGSRGSRDRSRRDRGDRGDRGERGDREGGRDVRGDRNRRAPRAPRGFAPSRALYGVENTAPLDDMSDNQPAREPIVLPGESLSKYRSAGAPEAPASSTAASTVAASRPSTEFTLTAAWDGGAVLPGESLSRRSRPEVASQAAPRSESRFETRAESRSGTRFPSRVESRPEPSRAMPMPAVVGDADGLSIVPIPSQQLGTIAATEPSQEERSRGDSAQSTPEEAAAIAPIEAAAEYEPVEASASLRYDPLPPSEYRQSAPAVEEAPSAAEPVAVAEEPSRAEAVAPSHVEVPAAPLPSIAHTITPQPQVALTPLRDATLTATPEPAAELIPDHDSGQDSGHDADRSGHDFTSMTSAGEMLSDVAMPPTLPESSDASDPMGHEMAILDTTSEPSAGNVSGANFFAPGDGALEEEELDDEEFDLPALQASGGDEHGYEEEALEGAADLGTMIRDLSIDQITRPANSGELDDDEILEEEDAAHDGLYVEAEEIEGDGFGSSNPDMSDDDLVPSDLTDTSEASFGAVAQDAEPSSDDRERTDRSRRDGGRRNDRGERNERRDRGRDRSPGDRDRGSRPGRRDGRHSMQTTNLPAISDLLKPGQEVLVQIAKEPIAKKGARITSHIALPGRFLVFMPTVNHTGVSRKIESDGERRRLKEILLSEKGEASGGFIVRTAASGASEEELRSDLRFLLNLWADIKQRSESSKSPALIYHDLNLVERILRDQVTDHFSAIWVDTEDAYERVLRFLQRFQPSLIRRVKLYTKDTPLFEQFGITEEINKALRSKVWLKSGGSIVINQTEALVAIDINTGKYVGKTARLEDTIVKTNLDAIPEIVRQIRLRDLGGIIIIDFIDMDERKNRNRVMAALEDELKKDRAPSKVLQFNDFGLVAITRKRVKQSLERTLSATCTICQGTGMTKSPVTISNDIYVEMRKMQKHLDRGDVMLRVNPEVVKQLKSPGTRWLQEMEELVGKTILVKSDPTLHPEQFDIH